MSVLARLSRGVVFLGIAGFLATAPQMRLAAEEHPDAVRFVTSYKDELEGLWGAASIAISRDGRHVYAAAGHSRTLLLLNRDAESGELKLHRTYQCPFARPRLPGTVQVPNLHFPKCVVLSPDDKHLYAISLELSVFARDAETGELSLVESLGQKPLVQVDWFAISPDGRNAYAVGAANGTLGVFARDQRTGALTRIEVFQDDESFSEARTKVEDARVIEALRFPRAVCVSPDGRNVYLAAYDDRALTTFDRDPESGRLTVAQTIRDVLEAGRFITGDHGLTFVSSLAISPDGELIYATSLRDQLSVFQRDAATGKLAWLTTLQNDRDVDGLDYPTLIHASGDNRHVYVASMEDRAVAVFRRDSERRSQLKFIQAIRDEEDGVDGVSGVCGFASDASGKHLYTLAQEQAIALFATNEAASAVERPAETERATLEALAGADDTPSYVCIPTGDPLPHEPALMAITFGRNDQALFTVTGDGELHRWDLATGQPGTPIILGGKVERARFSRDGNWLAAAVLNSDPFHRGVEVWDLKQESRACQMDLGNSILDLDISREGALVAVAMSDDTVTLWETKTGRTLARFEDLYNGGGSAANHVRFSPDGKRLANTCAGQLRWLSLDGRSERVRKTAKYLCPLQFSPDGKRLAFSEDRVRILDGATGDLLFSFDHVLGEGLEFSPDGRLLALASRGHVGAELVSAASGKRIAELPGGRGSNVAFSSDGKLLAMETVDHVSQPGRMFVTVWRLALQEP